MYLDIQRYKLEDNTCMQKGRSALSKNRCTFNCSQKEGQIHNFKSNCYYNWASCRKTNNLKDSAVCITACHENT